MSKARELAELGAVYDSGALSNRNVIINGAMKVAQRGTSSTGLGASDGYFTCDRWNMGLSTSGRLTMTQESDGPDGFANSIKLACTTADTSIGSSELGILRQMFEGQDLQRFAKGTTGAKEFTVSFYVKGNAAATYTAELYDSDNTRQISKTFSVTTDWTRVVLTYPADTTGAFGDDANLSLYLQIWLHAGSDFTSGTLNSSSWASVTTANRISSSGTSFFDSTSRTFFITGVQLEAGSEATPFEHRSFGQELQSCQRYFSKSYRYDKYAGDTSSLGWVQTEFHENNQGAGYREYYAFPFAVRMRATPTITIYDTAGNAGKCNYYLSVGSGNTNKVLNVSSTNERTFGGYSDRATSIGGWACHYTADAEL